MQYRDYALLKTKNIEHVCHSYFANPDMGNDEAIIQRPLTSDGTMLMAPAKIALRFGKFRRVVGRTSPSSRSDLGKLEVRGKNGWQQARLVCTSIPNLVQIMHFKDFLRSRGLAWFPSKN